MAHIFTDKHRELQGREINSPLYHGNYCEQQYIAGMELKAQASIFRKILKFKFTSTKHIRTHRPFSFGMSNTEYWKQVILFRNDPRPKQVLQRILKDTEFMLHIVKRNYQVGFIIHRSYMHEDGEQVSFFDKGTPRYETCLHQVNSILMEDYRKRRVTNKFSNLLLASIIRRVIDFDKLPVKEILVSDILNIDAVNRIQDALNNMGAGIEYPSTTSIRIKGKV